MTRRRHADLDVDSILGPDGALSGVLDGYEHRGGQLDMARAVATALTERHFLLAEAGTGTGKTLAYLVPAALSGKRVVISTATRTLQEQIFLKDIPLLRDKVGLKFDAALLKGRNNYLCAQRFEAFEKNPLFSTPDDAVHWEGLRDWAYHTETGDRGETMLPDTWATWSTLSTTSEQCLGSKCPLYEQCFVTRARRLAQDCQVIVVNHALFFADLALKVRGEELELGVLPAYDAVVFDEAHALEDVATDFFGRAVSSGRIASLVQDAMKALPILDARNATLTTLALAVRTRSDAFFQHVEALLAPEGTDVARLRDVRLGEHSLEEVRPQGAALLEALAAFSAVCPDDDTNLAPLAHRALESSLALDACLRADDATQVYWAQLRERGEHGRISVFLRSAPIDVGQSLSTHLYDSVDAVVFTSATLRAQPGPHAFDYVVQRLGLVDRAWRTLDVPSPFNYPQQAALYVPSHLPEPSHPEWTLRFAREVFQLLRLSGGRAFVLFTSLRHLDEVHRLVSPHLTMPLLRQGDAPRRALLEAFAATPSVLFASQSFWEGVDVPGDALSMVIIDRLPFAPPGEPLQAARMETIEARGGSAFDELQVPQAALALRQGFGRLIRTATDRGVVALGDVRITTKRYGRVFLEGLPPAKRLSRFDEVRSWWERHGPAPT